MENLYGKTEEQVKQWLVQEGFKPFGAAQIFNWLYVHQIRDFSEMLNLSKELRAKLAETFTLDLPQLGEVLHSEDGTTKFACILEDGKKIETVLLSHDDHNTLCVSTQVGCAMACKFCLTATLGLIRNLEPHEIVGQILLAKTLLPEGQTLRNLVFMGMGEPLHNYDNLILSLKILLNRRGLDFSWRRVTLSTSGLIEGIKRFWAETEVSAMLAISLNGVTQEARAQLMPVAKKHQLEELIGACRELPLETRQRITFEYVLLAGVTDDLGSAKRLVALLNGIKAKVNLIPFNEHPDLPYQAPSPEQVRAFQQYLLDRGLLCTVRKSRGRDVSAACGQLAAKASPTAC